MSDTPKERFKDLLRQVSDEYDMLHARIKGQIEPVSLQLPPLPGLVHSPGSIQGSESLREAGNPEQHPESEVDMEEAISRNCNVDVDASPVRRVTPMRVRAKPGALEVLQSDDAQQDFNPMKVTISKPAVSDTSHPNTQGISATLPVASVGPAKVRAKPRAIELSSIEDSEEEISSNMLAIPKVRFSAHSNPNSTSRSMTSSHAPVPPTPVASISPMSNGVKVGAIENPNNVKETVRRISTEIDMQSASTISRYLSTASFKERGPMAKIAKSKIFEVGTMVMILFNAIWIAVDADHNQETFLLDADPIFQVVEHFFCFAFCVELIIRFGAFKNKADSLSDPWFIFDAILVVLLIAETWIMTIVIAVVSDGSAVKGVNFSILRLLRVVRLARLARVMRAVPELCFMVKGVLQATRSVTCTMGLLLGILYVFGIALKQFSDNTSMGKKYFRTVPLAVFTLFTQGALLDNISILFMQVYDESLLCAILLLVVVVLTALTLMNMLIGVLCEVMNRVASMEKDRMAVSYVKEQIHIALAELDTNMDELIDREEFIDMLCNEKASQALKDVGVDVLALVDFADYYFQSDKHGESFDQQWSFDRFIEELMQLRGVNAATVKDAVELRKFIHSQNTSQNAILKHLMDSQTILARNQAKLEHLILHAKSTPYD